ncbi:MAG TPA: hypothetical protein VE911_08190 [Candidatus Nitrosopolaris sp.]|nr:hypothetical protein [Candidatus Nitrosopolaris sp.]
MPGHQLVDSTIVLAVGAGAARLWLRAIADEAMRYLYVLSSLPAVMSLPLVGLVVVIGAILLARARHAIVAGRWTTNVEVDEAGTACRMRTWRGSRGSWTWRRSIAFSRPRARSGGVST